MDRYKKHRKDKKITILEGKKNIVDGRSTMEYIPKEGLENIWAYYRHISGKEFFLAATNAVKVEVIFEINYRKDIDTNMRIKYNDEEYSITQIDDYEGKKTDLKIYACIIK